MYHVRIIKAFSSLSVEFYISTTNPQFIVNQIQRVVKRPLTHPLTHLADDIANQDIWYYETDEGGFNHTMIERLSPVVETDKCFDRIIHEFNSLGVETE